LDLIAISNARRSVRRYPPIGGLIAGRTEYKLFLETRMSRRRIRPAYATVEPHVDAVALLRQQFRQWHADQEDCAAPWLHASSCSKPWSLSVRLYQHALCAEDIMIQSVLREDAPLFMSLLPNWGGPADVAVLRQYARALYASTDAYLAELPSHGLVRVVDLRNLGLGRRTVLWVIKRFVGPELRRIRSEIAGGTGSTGNARIHQTLPSAAHVLARTGVLSR
jgi:hypothetical protein